MAVGLAAVEPQKQQKDFTWSCSGQFRPVSWRRQKKVFAVTRRCGFLAMSPILLTTFGSLFDQRTCRCAGMQFVPALLRSLPCRMLVPHCQKAITTLLARFLLIHRAFVSLNCR